MNRRDFLKAAAAFGAAATIQGCQLTRHAQFPAKPNIILIMADDLGYECLGANGGESYETPVLDSLARTGIRFEHCYSQPLCTPSRVQIMTGIYNVRNYTNFGVLDRSQTTFAHLLKKGGYRTCVAGKWQLGKEADSARYFGFDRSCLWYHTRRKGRYPNPGIDIDGEPADPEPGDYGPDAVSDFVCDFIEENERKPFFVYYPMILTHCPFEPTPDSPDWDPASKGSETYKGDARYFGDMVSYMDRTVGKITARLDALGLREKTLILFTADNGTDKPIESVMNGRVVAGGKKSMTDAGTRVPFIANWPGVVPEGQVSGDLIDFTDFLPTLCEAAGVPVPSTLKLDGTSFLMQLKGLRGKPREWIYCWFARNGGPVGEEWARNQQYKLYRSGSFYNVKNDVLEENPLEDLSPEEQEIRAMLEDALDRFRESRPAEVSAKGGKVDS